MRVFLLDSSYNGNHLYTLRNKEKQYLTKVLRLEKGITFIAKDRYENYYDATLIDDSNLALIPTKNIEDHLLDNLSSYTGDFANLNMYISILKGKKNELIVKALTEIGVKKIIFVQSQYVQEKEFSPHQKERLETIIKEAVQQSGAITPDLLGPISFSSAISNVKGKAILLHQSMLEKTKSLRFASLDFDIKDEISCFIGPEGGFSDEECLLAEQKGITPVLLNTNILRAETAAIYTASALQVLLQG